MSYRFNPGEETGVVVVGVDLYLRQVIFQRGWKGS